LYCIRNHVGAKNELPLDGRKKSPWEDFPRTFSH
jgi:hypothetical protein